MSGGATGRLLGLLLLLPACLCTTPVESYDSPLATLELWQARLCHDDVEGEYACLALGFQRRLGGYENYYTARARLLDERPVVSWFFLRADLGEWIESDSMDPDGRYATLVLDAGDGPLVVSFERETWITACFGDGRVETARHAGPPGTLLVRDEASGRQWLAIERPDLAAATGLREVRVSARWLISDLAGMAEAGRTAPGVAP